MSDVASTERMQVLARFLRSQIALANRPPVGRVELNNEEAEVCALALEGHAREPSARHCEKCSGCRECCVMAASRSHPCDCACHAPPPCAICKTCGQSFALSAQHVCPGLQSSPWARKQYQKIQDFVIRRGLYRGEHPQKSHADIVIELAERALPGASTPPPAEPHVIKQIEHAIADSEGFLSKDFCDYVRGCISDYRHALTKSGEQST